MRNFLVWRKLLVPSLIANFGEPLLYLLAFGYGFGHFVKTMDHLPYLVFLASGIVCSSAMNAASFEALYSAYTRMEMQKTWEAILSAPLEPADVIFGEVSWAATKGLINALAIVVVGFVLQLWSGLTALWVFPVIFLMGFAFAAIAMIMTVLARSYDFFVYYMILLLTPLLLISGVFFPLSALPAPVVFVARLLPLTHAIELIRPLLTGRVPHAVFEHVAVLVAYGLAGYGIATAIAYRRLRT
jgi:lipooligosaccharide transport system permease protein